MYENILLHTGIPGEEGLSSPLTAAQARAVQERRSTLLAAASLPRNEEAARLGLMAACRDARMKRLFCDEAGRPTLCLARTAARLWGNVTYGLREHAGGEWEAFAWDMERNVRAVRRFTPLPGEHGEKTAERRLLAALLELLPAHVLQDALEQSRISQEQDRPPALNDGRGDSPAPGSTHDAGPDSAPCAAASSTQKRAGNRLPLPGESASPAKACAALPSEDESPSAKEAKSAPHPEHAIPGTEPASLPEKEGTRAKKKARVQAGCPKNGAHPFGEAEKAQQHGGETPPPCADETTPGKSGHAPGRAAPQEAPAEAPALPGTTTEEKGKAGLAPRNGTRRTAKAGGRSESTSLPLQTEKQEEAAPSAAPAQENSSNQKENTQSAQPAPLPEPAKTPALPQTKERPRYRPELILCPEQGRERDSLDCHACSLHEGCSAYA